MAKFKFVREMTCNSMGNWDGYGFNRKNAPTLDSWAGHFWASFRMFGRKFDNDEKRFFHAWTNQQGLGELQKMQLAGYLDSRYNLHDLSSIAMPLVEKVRKMRKICLEKERGKR